MDLPEPLMPVVARLADAGGTLFVIGATDTGKTWLTWALLREILRAGARTAWVDADVGQSHLGPPATMGLSVFETPEDLAATEPPVELRFVGATSPAGHVAECMIAAMRLVERARARGAKAVVVDTTGLVTGPEGRELKERKIELCDPDVVVAIARGSELHPILAPLRALSRPEVVVLAPSPKATAKSEAFRKRHREDRFRRYFERALKRDIPVGGLAIFGHWLGAGTPLEPAELSAMSRMCGILSCYGERVGDALYLFLPERGKREAVTPLLVAAKVTEVVREGPDDLKNRIVGLLGKDRSTIGLGLIQEFNPERRRLSILTPVIDLAPLAGLHFGSLRVAPDGREVIGLRAG